MHTSGQLDQLNKFQIPGQVAIGTGKGGLSRLLIHTPASEAEIYLQGAHVTRFQKQGEEALLFLSECSRFEPGQPIRGGIPIILPWFGNRPGSPAHGFARTSEWTLNETTALPGGGVRVVLTLPGATAGTSWSPFEARYTITVTDTLAAELTITNLSADTELPLENCLHTYFTIGDVDQVTVRGLKGIRFLDKVANFAEKIETGEEIRVTAEVDRVYLDTTDRVEIADPALQRRIRVAKSGSASTVVWNPWIAKAKAMADFGDEEYRGMICVESGNVAANQLKIPPGGSATLGVVLSSTRL